MNLRKPMVAATFAIAGLLAAGAARAGDVHWSIGVNLPVHPNVSIGVSSAPPVVYRRAPVYGVPVVVAPAPRVVYVPAPVYVDTPRWDRAHRHGHKHAHRHPRDGRRGHDRWGRHDDWRDGRRY